MNRKDFGVVKKILPASFSFKNLVFNWPLGMPMLLLTGPERYSILVLDFVETSVDALQEVIGALAPHASLSDLPFHFGYLGLLSYDEYSGVGDTKSRCRIFKIDSAIIYDHSENKAWLTRDPDSENKAPMFSERDLEALAAQSHSSRVIKPEFHLVPDTPDDEYLEKCGAAIRDIRDGRYYQINLLRYFQLKNAPKREDLLSHFFDFCGANAAWLDIPGVSVISFSPERFVKIKQEDGSYRAICEPIKGTASRFSCSQLDKKAGDDLLKSPKNLCELHIIIDLMRNDLNKVSQPGTVKVLSPGTLRSFPNVHHLVGIVSSVLDPRITLDAFFRALCPAGSITGAPKQEVMKAIREYEGSERGYFMGNVFYFDRLTGNLDSSVLIRTIVSQSGGPAEFAAGSGIVIASDPKEEMNEIQAKTNILNPLNHQVDRCIPK